MKINPVVSAAIATTANKPPPVQAARAAIAAQPELADQPFGKLVSSFARGIPLPSSSTPDDTSAVPDPSLPQTS